ncbi:hypothetical protein L1987_46247 [Smallanthus sonchifolius]|uniref:Uncharacterized protein n=1 Tax=Smallanthus sonchifolius TaxID=185202 RepID=A0ACB9FZ05_9ASTR|nr:hypothetical protein L1987_46247 [Smallanthus sonchifolius]
MSDNTPLEIQEEIMKRLPVKSLIQFRCVSKTWKSLIDSSDFIANYTHMQHLLVTYGFGVCPVTNDPKIVKITYIDNWVDIKSKACIPWRVEVFSLSTGAWRSAYTTNLPRKLIHFYLFSVDIDGIIYWLTEDRISIDGGFKYYSMITSFDMTSEEFGEVYLPDTLAHSGEHEISKLRNSLVVLGNYMDTEGFGFDLSSLVVYESSSERIVNLDIDVLHLSFCVHPYTTSA